MSRSIARRSMILSAAIFFGLVGCAAEAEDDEEPVEESSEELNVDGGAYRDASPDVIRVDGGASRDASRDASRLDGSTSRDASPDVIRCVTNLQCNDGNKCTRDTCVSGVCRHTRECTSTCGC
jgi:hypothetical protein